MQSQNPNYEQTIREKLKGQHFMHLIGFDLTEIREGHIEGWLTLEEKHRQQFGFVHGGVISTLCDIVAGFAAYSLVPPDCGVVTGELKISYFKPGLGERLHVVGRVLKAGRRIHFCEAEVYAHTGDKRDFIAKATTTMVVVKPTTP
ncbi:uncharacterized domain 1-containing protein [Catalinimonas alkaloidigena]|uniref:Medium/long-chain acyl-CoA thioesterase YigI n=1 Tax=Catalinimonas alkaloidigena TaxID=1075417 RepID=A0A1G9K2E1_9BACT|nr:PaaI family thioesterase [Catalinimonas alkaloidigena]SDL43951.1 uncharacterized domain 1-containing protein [Catalinimonas alkaloidigena]